MSSVILELREASQRDSTPPASGGGADHRMTSDDLGAPRGNGRLERRELRAIVEQEIGAHLAPQIRILTLAESARTTVA